VANRVASSPAVKTRRSTEPLMVIGEGEVS
jgi:hypothetical protein